MHQNLLSHHLLMKIAIGSLLAIWFCASSGTITLSQKPDDAKLAKIEFEGLQRVSRDQLIKTSGLEIGQAVDVKALDAASQRLMDSGLVKKLSYRFRTAGNQATLIFQIEEARGGDSPVLFDNFIWFGDDELANAVRREVPYFNGTAPNSGNLTDAITLALQHFLGEHKIIGTAEYTPSGDLAGNMNGHVFAVRGITMPVCTLHFPGAHNVDEARLIRSSKDLFGIDYSKAFAGAFAVNNLFPIYRELGQLRATFAPPLAKPKSDANCKEGVDVTIGVDEGAIYSWDKAEWSGNQVLSAQELDAALDMKPGEVANGVKFDKGILAVRKAYGRKGYIAAWIRSGPEFDDASTRVSYRMEIKEGPQYHMGNLIIKGFPDNLANLLRAKWELRPGDVYDKGYIEQFRNDTFRDAMRKLSEERRAQGKPLPKKVIAGDQPNGATRTVDVIFEIGDSADNPGNP